MILIQMFVDPFVLNSYICVIFICIDISKRLKANDLKSAYNLTESDGTGQTALSMFIL